MQLYLTVRPEDTRIASAYPAGLAHAAYRIGEGSSLLSRNLLTPARSGPMAPLPGLLVLSDRSAPSIDRPAALAEAVLRECARRSYGGIVLDFDEPSREDRRRFAALLGQQCAKSRKFFCLPPSYAGAAEHPTVIVNTAISGGSFETHIREELARYGGGRNVVFDLQRLRMDFRLPARSGQGEPLTQAALDALIRKHQPAVFFSKDLFARYFTYAKNGESHFILFDDADTLRQKLRLGRQLGVAAAFFQWPEVCDIADSLFRRK